MGRCGSAHPVQGWRDAGRIGDQWRDVSGGDLASVSTCQKISGRNQTAWRSNRLAMGHPQTGSLTEGSRPGRDALPSALARGVTPAHDQATQKL